MNLYKIMINHYAPKDSCRAIASYIVADSSEQIFNYLLDKGEIEADQKTYYLSWQDMKDDYELDDFERFRNQIIESGDEEGTDFANYDDLYYGRRFVSWELVKENAKPDVLQLISSYGIPILNAFI